MKVYRTYEWNGHKYSVVEDDQGNRIEIKDSIDPIATAITLLSIRPPVEIFVSSIDQISDEVLTKEVERRNLTLRVRGSAV